MADVVVTAALYKPGLVPDVIWLYRRRILQSHEKYYVIICSDKIQIVTYGDILSDKAQYCLPKQFVL